MGLLRRARAKPVAGFELLSLGYWKRMAFQKQGDTFYSAAAKMFLCKAYWKSGDYDAAVTAGTKAVEVGRKHHLEELADFVYTLEYLGMSLARTARGAEAEPRAQKAFLNAPGLVAIAEGTVGESWTAQDRFSKPNP